jgi:23S rRNA-/tRNA-specific pseudouridylate synthase
VQKTYLAVVHGRPSEPTWHCNRPIGPDPHQIGRMRIDPQQGKPAETHFRALAEVATPDGVRTLVEATPITGRTHQIRVHLAAGRLPILGDSFYRATLPGTDAFPIALRAIQLEYRNPFTRRPVHIEAPTAAFLRAFGFTESHLASTRIETGPGTGTGIETKAKGRQQG